MKNFLYGFAVFLSGFSIGMILSGLLTQSDRVLEAQNSKDHDSIMWDIVEVNGKFNYYKGEFHRSKGVTKRDSMWKYSRKLDSILIELKKLNEPDSEVHQTIPKKKEI